MDDKERKLFRDALFEDPQSPDELRERFEEQARDLISPRLSKARRIAYGIAAVVYLCLVPVFAYAFHGVLLRRAESPFIRLILSLSFAGAAVVFLWTGVTFAIQSWSGRAPGRQVRAANEFIPFACLLVFVVVMLVKLPGFDLPYPTMISAASAILFLWGLTVGMLPFTLLRWQRRDLLIEQKRLALEIAILREELHRNRVGEKQERSC